MELRDRKDVLIARVRIGTDPVTVGRDPTNEVEIRDEYADAYHLRAVVRPDGVGVTVTDLGTVNGCAIGDRVIRGQETNVAFGESVGVGESTVTFVSSSTEVPEAKLLQRSEGRAFPYDRIPLWGSTGILLATLVVAFWLLDYEAMGPLALVGAAGLIAALPLLWASLWAAGSRLGTGRGHFREHLAFTNVWLLALAGVSTASGWLAFAAGSAWVDRMLEWILLGALAWSLVFFGHLDILSRRTPRFKALIAGGLAATALALALAVSRTNSSPPELIQRSLRTIYPVAPSLTRSESLDSFLERAASLEQAHAREPTASEEAGADR